MAYSDAVVGELADIEAAYLAVWQASAIDRYTPVPGVIGLPPWSRAPCDPPLEAARMALLAQVRDLRPRFELLFRHPTPEVTERHTDAFNLLGGWVVRLDERLDSAVPDDRLVAAALLLRSAHPGSAVFVATGEAVRLPFVAPPD